MGALLIEIDADRARAPWDGVFFELTRDHDLSQSEWLASTNLGGVYGIAIGLL